MQWFVMKNGQQSGPYTVEQLREKLGTLELASTDHVWREGMAGWLPISAALATTPPPMPPAMPPPPLPGGLAPPRPASAAKSHALYVVLALFIGSFGIHNFYVGRSGRGMVQMLITVCSFGLLVWVVWIWSFIDVLTVTTDGDGVALR